VATPNSIALSLIKEVGESTDDADFVLLVEKQINKAVREISLVTNFNPYKARAPFNTAIGTPTYNMPATARELIQLRFVTDSAPISYSTTQELVARRLKLTDPGRPQFWLEDGVVLSGSDTLLKIRLVPVPVAVESIEEEHYFDPTDTASASHIPIPSSWTVPVEDRALSFLLENLGKYDASALAIRRYEKSIKRIADRENNKNADKAVLQEVDLANLRRRRGPRLPGNFPDTW
jgi:hypothetical protein